ncbi:MAG: enoyl-CoA hydratase/isomerase family protein [Calditrichia bacterium]
MNNVTIIYGEQEQTALLTLNRPQVHNAVNEAMMQRFEEVITMLNNKPHIRAVILTGAGEESFCSGGDLKYFATFTTREQALQMSRRMRRILDGLSRGRILIGAANGRALGGGCEILSACHFRLAAQHAAFSFRQAANGLITGWGGGVRLLRLLSRTNALNLLLTGRTIDAFQAAEIGFIDEVTSPDELNSAARKLAADCLRNAAPAVRGFLELEREYQLKGREAAEKLEEKLFGDLWMGPDFREWLSGFIAKE